MSLEFKFDRIEDARKFGKNVSRSLKATSVHERRENKHFIVIPEKNLNKIAEATLIVSIVMAGLISGNQHLDDQKYGIVINAMQRANPKLSDLTEHEIGQHLSGLTPEQIQDVVSNTKGIYHEMLYVDTYNNSSTGEEASLHPDLNNPESDITFTSDGEADDVNSFDQLVSISTSSDVATETVSATIGTDEIIGLGPISLIGLLFGIF